MADLGRGCRGAAAPASTAAGIAAKVGAAIRRDGLAVSGEQQGQDEAAALAQIFDQATGHHAAGRLAEAEALYRRILAAVPRQPDTLYLLGTLAYQTGHPDTAADLARQAIGAKADVPAFYVLLGNVLHDQRQLEGAATCFRRALSLDAGSVGGHLGLANVLQDQDRMAEAVTEYHQALALNARDANIHNNLGGALLRLDQPEAALACFDQAIMLAPGRADPIYNRANALRALGRGAEAEDAYRQALALSPAHRDATLNLANLLLADGRAAAAESLYRQVLARAPDHVDALMNLGVALHGQGRVAAAEEGLNQARALAPGRADVLNNLGLVLAALRRRDEAVALYRQALALRPDLADAACNLAAALAGQDDAAGALAHAEQALRLRPDDAKAHMAMGNALAAAGDFAGALTRALEAARRAPTLATAHGNAALMLSYLGRPAEALAHFDRAAALTDVTPEILWNRSLTRLLLGDFAAGWVEYERRWDTDLMKAARRPYAQPLWRGQRAQGRPPTLLLHAEQGLGDTLQFCRYAPLAAERGYAVVLEVQRPLLRLLRSLPGVAEGRISLVAAGDPLPPFDLHCPLMSLPLAFRTTLDTVPAVTPYLAADLSRWRDAVAAGGSGLKVGLVWAGNPRTSVPDRRRSIDPTLLAPLADVSGVCLFSLQKEGAAPAGLPLTDLMSGVADFADTAALISQLDLVISVDTAVAHLAGALGRPVWLLNRFDTDWRWLLGRDDSPWYPTLRQFRQTTPGDWQTPIARACDALAQSGQGV
ncbi:hypothetical protein Y958_12310 [Nitrospirillum viridazoti CBAmc]|uniref:Glycosyltransferase n=1 Tax=Nitrospirillum viridazoti CBAmc TaxID=1441467 RepID=A0A248JS25_9PROT|nr:hypothetical protein Y958_12310 [Nitrospirillum amazonense CBAmc]